MVPDVLVGAFDGSAASAADTTILLKHKAWSVEHNYDATDGSQYCLAGTWSNTDTSFDVLAFDDGTLGVGLFDTDWNMPVGGVRHIVADVDYERWTSDASVIGEGHTLFVKIPSLDTAVELLTDIRMGSAVAVYNEDMRRIATFSLAGSAAAIAKLVECWQRIYAPSNPGDPFLGASAQDPFL